MSAADQPTAKAVCGLIRKTSAATQARLRLPVTQKAEEDQYAYNCVHQYIGQVQHERLIVRRRSHQTLDKIAERSDRYRKIGVIGEVDVGSNIIPQAQIIDSIYLLQLVVAEVAGIDSSNIEVNNANPISTSSALMLDSGQYRKFEIPFFFMLVRSLLFFLFY